MTCEANHLFCSFLGGFLKSRMRLYRAQAAPFMGEYPRNEVINQTIFSRSSLFLQLFLKSGHWPPWPQSLKCLRKALMAKKSSCEFMKIWPQGKAPDKMSKRGTVRSFWEKFINVSAHEGVFEQQMPDSEERTVLVEQKFTGAKLRKGKKIKPIFFSSSLSKSNKSDVSAPAFN